MHAESHRNAFKQYGDILTCTGERIQGYIRTGTGGTGYRGAVSGSSNRAEVNADRASLKETEDRTQTDRSRTQANDKTERCNSHRNRETNSFAKAEIIFLFAIFKA